MPMLIDQLHQGSMNDRSFAKTTDKNTESKDTQTGMHIRSVSVHTIKDTRIYMTGESLEPAVRANGLRDRQLLFLGGK